MSQMNEFTMRLPDDFHIHFRQDELLISVVGYTAACFGRALVMPNPKPPIRTGQDIHRYRKQILDATTAYPHFEPLMTFEITPETTVADVISAKKAGAVAGKIYPRAATTNSDEGVLDYTLLEPVYQKMEKLGLVLCLHGEVPQQDGEEETYFLYKETKFLPILEWLTKKYPKLRIVLEHISSAAAVDMVLCLPDTVAATITLHHLELTTNEVLGRNHHHCKPAPKSPEDRAALVWAILSGNKKFFLGSDSAPHKIGDKECAIACAGVYTAPVLLPCQMQFFERHQAVHLFENVSSRFGAEFYGLPLNEGTITLIREDWQVPAICGEVVPYKAGEILHWKVA